MTTFQNNLKTHISIFMHHLVKSNAQWINKPKFHMLTHLPASILRFGPAPLFATKKFKSYNGILRNASTHSNRLAPGRNIAIKFGNFHALRSVLSGGVSYNQKTQTTSNASPQVLNIFQNTPSIQNSMGYDAASYQFAKQFPFESPVHQPTNELPIPPSLRTQFPSLEFCQIIKSSNVAEYIGCVNSIWNTSAMFVVFLTKMKDAGVNPYYGMQQFSKTNAAGFVLSSDIVATLNLQHNCFDGKSSFHAPEEHRRMAQLAIRPIQPNELVDGINQGHETWNLNCED
ncbi:hypothetical protein PCASD_06815 [Puccinia coronata f. sp. avenae]|uniref:Uncharacterized protein n=1 Tax=Puccinia coronata f. sp. avenae TaxID=200324 RepID=A0A2N5UQC1_9BASI|nr:hypothetical protein PCASD_06815 [Puccinia coronata f. sp. avenae]